jgi:phosphoglycolate phosphatase
MSAVTPAAPTGSRKDAPAPVPGAVVFDLDGTLVDSAPDLCTAANRMLERSGRRPLALDEVKMMVGDGAAKLVERAFAATGEPLPDGDALAAQHALFLEFYDGHGAIDTTPYPGALAMLERLRAAGCRMGVCTNKPQRPTEQILDGLGLAPFFAAVLGGDVLETRKPDGAPLREVLRRLSADPAGAVMVGDSINDVATARAAGVPVIAVTFGYPRMPVAELGADLLIDSFDELPAAFARLKR